MFLSKLTKRHTFLDFMGWVGVLNQVANLKDLGICKGGRQKGVSLICSENKSEQIGTNRKKTGYDRKPGAQIGTDRKKSEQIGVTPFLEDRNLLKLRSLHSSCPFFLSENSIWGQ